MKSFFYNYGSTVIVALIVTAVIILAVRKMIKDKKSGKSSCSYGCEGCAYKDNCHKK